MSGGKKARKGYSQVLLQSQAGDRPDRITIAICLGSQEQVNMLGVNASSRSVKHALCRWTGLGVTVFFVFVFACPAHADNRIFWQDEGGSTGMIGSAVWNDIQSAITNAQTVIAGTGRGEVRLSGDFQRIAGDDSVATGYSGLHISSNARPITLSGGWDSGFDEQAWRTVWNATHDVKQAKPLYSTLDVNGSDSEGNRLRVLYVGADDSRVEGLRITGGYATVNPSDAGGIWVMANDSRLANLDICDNTTQLAGGGVRVGDGYGDGKRTNVVVKYCIFSDNISNNTGSPYCHEIETSQNTLVALCIFTGAGTIGNSGGGALATEHRTGATIFGCLFHDLTASPGAIVGHNEGGEMEVVNCTVVDNAGKGFRSGTVNHGFRLEIHNSIFSENLDTGIELTDPRGTSDYSGFLGKLLLFDDDITVETAPYYDEGDIQSGLDPRFVGQGGHSHRLTANSPAREAGGYVFDMTQAEKDAAFGAGDGNRIRFLKVNHWTDDDTTNTAYIAKSDIIVDLGGYAATDADYMNHYIYTHDLAGNPRVREDTIDLGAYEFQPPYGTVIVLR
jgi:hypothetical protein